MRTSVHDLSTVATLATIAKAVYQDGTGSPDSARWVRSKHARAECLRLDDHVIVAVAGSNDIGDWIDNLDTRTSSVAGVPVHQGFARHAGLISEGVEAALHDLTRGGALPVLFTGHSLGGAVAQILSLTMSYLVVVRGVVTFGSPKVGGHEFARELTRHVEAVHVANRGDWVPHLPTWIRGWRSAGTMIRLGEDGTRLSGTSWADIRSAIVNKALTEDAAIAHSMDEYMRRITLALYQASIYP